MIPAIRLYKIKNIIRAQWTVVVSFVVFLLLVIVVLVFYKKFNEETKSVDLLTGEVQMLKNRYDTLQYNKTLTEDQIKEYNKLLVNLIPESEDFFSIISALELISVDSKFSITDYVVDMSKPNKDKLTITIIGKGDTEAFRSFLEKYQFGGGRLITSDKIEYGGGSNSANTKISLTFYSKRFAFDETLRDTQLSKEELERLDKIKQKISLNFVSTDSQLVDTDYKLKKDPFSAQE